MKNFIILLICCLTIVSCETTTFSDYIVENDTEHNVVIYAFDSQISTTKADETIEILSKYKYSVTKATSGYHSEHPGIFNRWEVDSVIIVFDNKKAITQACNYKSGMICDIERNIMNYYDITNFVPTISYRKLVKAAFTYTITEEDYNNAIPIEETGE